MRQSTVYINLFTTQLIWCRSLLLALSKKIFPLLVYVLLCSFYRPFIALLEAVCKSSLEPHELLYGKLLLRLIGKSVFSVYNLIYRPYAGIYRSLADRDEILCRIIPASGAGSKNVDKCGALGIDSAVCLLMEIRKEWSVRHSERRVPQQSV